MTKNLYVGYARVSTARQVEAGSSLQDQYERIHSYVERQSGDLVAYYTDEGISGKDHSRPGLAAAVREAKKHRAQLVTISLSRLSRSTQGLLALADDLEQNQVGITSLREGFDGSSPVGRLLFRVIAALSEFEVDCLKERVIECMDSMKIAGKRTSGIIPFGYSLDPDGSTLNKVDSEQSAIKQMQRLRKEGLSFRKIANVLQDQNIPTRLGGQWTGRSIAGILNRQQKITPQQ